MIRTLRGCAPTVVSAGLLIAGCGLGAHAAGAAAGDSVSRAELYGTLGAAGVIVFGAFWTLLGSATNRMERSVEGLCKAIELHQCDETAHGPAIRERSRPILEAVTKIDAALERLDAKLDATREIQAELLAEHRIIRASDADACRAIRGQRRRHDDPPEPSE